MNNEKMEVFERALLYIYRANLENLGLKGDLKIVYPNKGDEKE